MKKTVFTYHSHTKYFSGLILNTFCIITPTTLPPSNAGIGKILNIASAKDIIQANAKYNIRALFSINFSQTLITHTGQDKEFNESFILDPSNDIKLFHNVHKAEKVNFHCSHISLNDISIALCTGNFISFKVRFHDDVNAIHNTQFVSGHCVLISF